jgi:hypothetical protein
MNQRWLVRAALAVLLGVGVAAGSVRAQTPAPLPNAEPWAVIEFGAGTPRPASCPAAEPPAASHHSFCDWLHSRPRPIADHVHACMHAHGVGCWSHHNMYTCGSWKSECTFIFGSCREFFGEPCLPGPPPPPAPPGYPGPGAYGMPAGRSGCPSCQ